jgi:hypothetical protein
MSASHLAWALSWRFARRRRDGSQDGAGASRGPRLGPGVCWREGGGAWNTNSTAYCATR